MTVCLLAYAGDPPVAASCHRMMVADPILLIPAFQCAFSQLLGYRHLDCVWSILADIMRLAFGSRANGVCTGRGALARTRQRCSPRVAGTAQAGRLCVAVRS